MSRLTIRRINSVARYLAVTMEFAAAWGNAEGYVMRPWFRGHADASWKLLPGLYRGRYRKLSEEDCRGDFQKRAFPYLAGTGREPKNAWEWYFLMQHHGLPTRLLDWSESALVGLYFAVREPKDGRDAAVWMLDPWWLNESVSGVANCVATPADGFAQPYLWPQNFGMSEIPIAVDPPHGSKRLAAQKGAFTLHGRGRKPLEDYPEAREAGARLVKIIIPAADVRNTKIQLAIAGISETTVFPDLASLSRELLEYWSGEW